MLSTEEFATFAVMVNLNHVRVIFYELEHANLVDAASLWDSAEFPLLRYGGSSTCEGVRNLLRNGFWSLG